MSATTGQNHWHLVQLTPEAAEQHDRMVYRAGPDVRFGWKPYTYRATRGAVAQFAAHSDEELATRLKSRGLKVAGWTDWRDGIRTTELVDA